MARHRCLNLDAMSRDELAGLDESTLHPLQLKIRNLLITAKGDRIAGRIPEAFTLEQYADRFYAQLPISLRW